MKDLQNAFVDIPNDEEKRFTLNKDNILKYLIKKIWG